MKPVKLTMTAFGPYGTQQMIDFTELADHKLFLITGPTGAGKTTVFDAISYALYGESSGDMRTTEGLRSHFAKEDLKTEVSLEFSLKNKTYHIHRIPKQTRKKERGEGYREIAASVDLIVHDNLLTTDATYSGAKNVDEIITRDIGLDANQFKQIMMIPQGEFRKLLTATSQERELVLNQLFDTSLYRSIQMRLEAERKKTADRLEETRQEKSYYYQSLKLSEMEDHPLNIALTGENPNMSVVLNAIIQLVKEDQEQMTQLDEKLAGEDKKLKSALARKQKAEEINTRFTQLERLVTEEKSYLERQPHIAEIEQKLQRFDKSQEIRPLYEQMKIMSGNMVKKQGEIEAASAKTRVILEEYEQIALNRGSLETPEAVTDFNDKQSEVTLLRPLIEKVHMLRGMTEELAKSQQEILRLQRQFITEEASQKGLADKEELRIKQLEALENVDKELGESRLLASTLKRENKLFETIQLNQSALEKQKKQLELLEQQEALAIETLNKEELGLKALQRDYHLGIAALIARDLEENAPCPVCGSTAHPSKASVDKELIEQRDIDRQEASVEKARAAFQKAITTSNGVKGTIENAFALLFGHYQELKELLEKEDQQIFGGLVLHESRNITWDTLEPVSVKCLKDAQAVKSRIQSLEEQVEQKASLIKDGTLEKEARESVKQSLLAVTKSLTQVNLQESQLQGQIDTLSKDIPETYRDADVLENHLQSLEKEVTAYKLTLETLVKESDLKRQQWIESDTLQKAYTQDLETQKEYFTATEKQFTTSLSDKGFSSKEDFTASLLPMTEVDRIKEEIAGFKERCIQIKQSIGDLALQVKDQRVEDITGFDVLISEIEKQRGGYAADRNLIANRKDTNVEIKGKLVKLAESTKRLEKDYEQIGSMARVANGSNALRITFERFVLAQLLVDIVQAANLRLRKMTDNRYTLKRSETNSDKRTAGGLDLEIHDDYTGRSRPVRTLSGGETFKASLAMALGLSDVVQSTTGGVRLDTMFIDEGFGTLDPESLDQAINCLIDLQKTGRVVGIISHVPELKERIDARLEVSSTMSGSSAKFVL